MRASLLEAAVLRERGDSETALARLDKALDSAREFGLRGMAAEIQAERALCLGALRRHKEAADAACEALAFFEEQAVNHPLRIALGKLAPSTGDNAPSSDTASEFPPSIENKE